MWDSVKIVWRLTLPVLISVICIAHLNNFHPLMSYISTQTVVPLMPSNVTSLSKVCNNGLQYITE